MKKLLLLNSFGGSKRLRWITLGIKQICMQLLQDFDFNSHLKIIMYVNMTSVLDPKQLSRR